ncbi:MAG: type III polyketide synthase [Acetobacteraceae bacterium]
MRRHHPAPPDVDPREGMRVNLPWLNRIGSAVPAHDIHAEFIDYALSALAAEPHRQALFERMAALADIEHRYAILEPAPRPRTRILDQGGFYRRGAFPSTAQRMERYGTEALALAMQAIAALDIDAERNRITHLVVASCTGFTAPGLDFQILRAAGLDQRVERTLVGFMGCFAAVNALKLAWHIARSSPEAMVLVVATELSSLHLQERFDDLATLLSFLLFGDGAAACLVSNDANGILLGPFKSTLIPDTEDLITWQIRDSGFVMHLSGQVPGHIRRFLPAHGTPLLGGRTPADVSLWAVHAGGRSILDAVQQGLQLPPDALRHSRAVLREYGNMSSATLMFVLDRIMRAAPQGGATGGDGLAMAFGPGLTVETFAFRRP